MKCFYTFFYRNLLAAFLQQCDSCQNILQTHAIKSEITQQLSPLLHLPLVPLSDGRVVSLKDASQILSMAEASKNMQTVRIITYSVI